ncbi:MAG: pyridoxal phosphate-dependent decarboxylase family protein [Cyclobacteriaceae bacterium]
MNSNTFRAQAHLLVDWMADYLENIEKFPVKSQVSPGEIYSKLPQSPPSSGESMEAIIADFKEVILPGITHWQHPHFHAYFAGNSSFPSVLAEMLTATMGAQCMLWDTSPAAAELEERVLEWLGQMLGLPSGFTGVIQDGASTATLCALLTAREKYSDFTINKSGAAANHKYRIYCSTETHSSIEKAAQIAGLGSENVVKVAVDKKYAMESRALELAIEQDLDQGFRPLCVITTLGTTGSTAIDPLPEIAALTQKQQLWLHVDAAWAGTALVLPEYRWMIEGLEHADSFVCNPHKWMFTNFDCTAYFIKDPDALQRTFSVLPEYLRTQNQGQVNNYNSWGIPLGRRFRALKLWFVIREMGLDGIRETISNHISWAKQFAQWVEEHPDFELLAPVPLALVCFRYKPGQVSDEEQLADINRRLLERLNKSGKMYLTHTKLSSKYTLRLVTGQTNLQEHHIKEAWDWVQEAVEHLNSSE